MPVRAIAPVATRVLAQPIALLAAAALLLTAAVAQRAAAQAPERHVLRGRTVEIWNLAGRATVEAGTGSEVSVELRRGGSDAERLQVEVIGNRLVVRYPERNIVYRDAGRGGNWNTAVTVRDDGTFSGDWRDNGGRTTRIRSSGSGFEAHADLVIRVPKGQEIALNLGAGAIEARDVEGTLALHTRLSRIEVRGLTGSLTARTGSGGIVAERVTGGVDLATGSGGIDLKDLRATTLKARTGSGTVDGVDITAESFDVNTGSGGMRIEGLGADEIRASAGSGRISLDLTKVARSAAINSGSGGVRLALPAAPDLEVHLTTGSGGISTDFPVTMDEVRRNSMRGTIGSGASGRLRVSTGSGGVRLVKR